MNLVKCNLRGKKHELRNQVCEDSIYWSQNDSVMTVAVADGAGSSQYPFAKQGSAAVSKAICEFFNARFDEFFDAVNELELMKVIDRICKKALSDVAEENKKETIDEFASTLLCVSVKDEKVIACHIGDGVLGRCIGGKAELLTMPENGEYAGSTYFMTMPDASSYIQVRKFYLGETSHIFLMTDGVGENIYNPVNGEFYNGIYGILNISNGPDGDNKLAQFINEKIVAVDDASDDCTVAIISFKNEDISIPANRNPQVKVPVAVQPGMPNFYPAQANNQMPANAPKPMQPVNPNARSIKSVSEENKKLRLITLILGAVSIILAVALAVVCVLAFSDKDDSDKGSKKDKEHITTTTSPDAETNTDATTTTETTAAEEAAAEAEVSESTTEAGETESDNSGFDGDPAGSETSSAGSQTVTDGSTTSQTTSQPTGLGTT